MQLPRGKRMCIESYWYIGTLLYSAQVINQNFSKPILLFESRAADRNAIRVRKREYVCTVLVDNASFYIAHCKL